MYTSAATTTTTTSTSSTTTNVAPSVASLPKPPREKKQREDKDYTPEKLKNLKKDELVKLCQANMITIIKGSKKETLLKSLINRQQQQQLVIPKKERLVGYDLPVHIIVKIFRYVWTELLDERHAVSLSLPLLLTKKERIRTALLLAKVNKQLFNIVSTFPCSYKTGNYPNSDWCAFKSPERVSSSHNSLDILFFGGASQEMVNIFGNVKELEINFAETQHTIMRLNSIRNIALVMPLVSFTASKIKLEDNHLQALATIKTLVKVDFSNIYKPNECPVNKSFFQMVHHPMKSIRLYSGLDNFDPCTNLNPIVRDSITTYEGPLPSQLIPNLRKFISSVQMKNLKPWTNITYFCADLASKLKTWVKIINQMVSLTTIEDTHLYNAKTRMSDPEKVIGNQITSPLLTYYIARFTILSGKEEYPQNILKSTVEFYDPTFKYLNEKWKFRKGYRKVTYLKV